MGGAGAFICTAHGGPALTRVAPHPSPGRPCRRHPPRALPRRPPLGRWAGSRCPAPRVIPTCNSAGRRPNKVCSERPQQGWACAAGWVGGRRVRAMHCAVLLVLWGCSRLLGTHGARGMRRGTLPCVLTGQGTRVPGRWTAGTRAWSRPGGSQTRRPPTAPPGKCPPPRARPGTAQQRRVASRAGDGSGCALRMPCQAHQHGPASMRAAQGTGAWAIPTCCRSCRKWCTEVLAPRCATSTARMNRLAWLLYNVRSGLGSDAHAPAASSTKRIKPAMCACPDIARSGSRSCT